MAGVPSCRRWFVFCAVALAAGCCCRFALAAEKPAAEKIEWKTSQPEAMVQARKQGKLLLIAHLSGDFANSVDDATPLQIYRGITLADARVTEELATRYVACWQQVGESASLARQPVLKRGVQPPPPLDFAITYFCLPDGRVLHFVPGYLSSDELLAELAWTEKCYSAVASLPDGEQPLAVRRAHQAAAAKADAAAFARRFPSRWKEDVLAEGPSTVDLPAAFAAARAAHEESLALRLGLGWPAKAGPGRLKALAAHGNLGRELAHLVLAEFPLAAHGDLARPAYQGTTGERFWEASKRRAELAARWKQAQSAGRPALLVVADDVFDPGPAAEGFAWPPTGVESIASLPRFATEVLSIDELAALIHDAGLDPVILRGAQKPPRYLVYSAAGKRTDLPSGATVSRLAQTLTATLETGAVAAAAGATKGESDEK